MKVNDFPIGMTVLVIGTDNVGVVTERLPRHRYAVEYGDGSTTSLHANELVFANPQDDFNEVKNFWRTVWQRPEADRKRILETTGELDRVNEIRETYIIN